jgi:hypothetical protein
VLIARDQTGATTDTILERVDTASITHHLAPIVAKDTLLISRGSEPSSPPKEVRPSLRKTSKTSVGPLFAMTASVSAPRTRLSLVCLSSGPILTGARKIGQEVGTLLLIAQRWDAHVRAGDNTFRVSNVAVERRVIPD